MPARLVSGRLMLVVGWHGYCIPREFAMNADGWHKV